MSDEANDQEAEAYDVKEPTMKTNTKEALEEILFLKLGLDLTRKDTQYPLVPAKDLQEAVTALNDLILLERIKTLENALESVEQADDWDGVERELARHIKVLKSKSNREDKNG